MSKRGIKKVEYQKKLRPGDLGLFFKALSAAQKHITEAQHNVAYVGRRLVTLPPEQVPPLPRINKSTQTEKQDAEGEADGPDVDRR